MNERIRELAEQAGLLHKQFGPSVETRHMKKKETDLEKFAELIVRECSGKVDWILAEGGKTQGDLIREHFGVEE
jgi:predicted fused transcriptional regulator/phosphomethylpyrimidine kinase